MRSMVLGRDKVLQHVAFATAGALATSAYAHFFAGSQGGSALDAEGEGESTSLQPRAFDLEGLNSWLLRSWKPLVGLLVLILMEVVQELGRGGEFSFRRVMNLEWFRESLRRLVRGQLPEMPQAEEDGKTSGPQSAEEREAVAAAEYANERAARRALARLRVDHLVFGVPGSLSDAMAAFEELTGVTPSIGGSHPSLGTHNAVVALGDGAYFEILCRDPEQPTPARLWMGMESLADSDEPRVLTWATDRAGQMEATVASARHAGYDPGDVSDFERQKPSGDTLRWSLAYRHYTRQQMGAGSGAVPFVIDWKGSASPAVTAPAGCELVGLRAEATDVDTVAKALLALGIQPRDLQLRPGPTDRLVATLRTPRGLIEF